AGGAGGAAAVSLTEFAISPEAAVVSGSGELQVRNDGTMAHNLVIPGTDLRTPDLNPGDEYTLDLSGLEPGTYEMLCDIAGHESAGMVGTITVGDVPAGETAAADDAGHG